MKDSRPLSDRFDLPYVRRKHFADRWTGRLGFLAAAATVVTVGALQMSADNRPYTAGPLTKAHDMFASDCTLCHQPSIEKGLGGLLMPASDEKCLTCHKSHAGLHAENQLDIFTMSMPGHPNLRASANCALCHSEHNGRDHNLSAVADQICVRCHADLAANGTALRPVAAPRRDAAPIPADAPPSNPAPAVDPPAEPADKGGAQ